jgi:hypothetical protein
MAYDPLPDVHFGRHGRKIDWRKFPEFHDPDDDEELPVTPRHVVELLGYDPLDPEPDDEPVKQPSRLEAIAAKLKR